MKRTPTQIHLAGYFRGRNFMTPEVVDYGRKGQHVWELSRGTRFLDWEEMWGVSVVLGFLPDGRHGNGTDLGNCFHTEAEARAYIAAGFREAGK